MKRPRRQRKAAKKHLVETEAWDEEVDEPQETSADGPAAGVQRGRITFSTGGCQPVSAVATASR
ncbi:hypothetical protein, partial [Streptomyces lavendulocolor]|uniref:hypothetical protein n=1 Tax=Streptomyces lavendulocolor TaxID=67316 RepID=UPI0033F8F330